MASFGSGSARTAIWHPGSSIERRPGFNQLSTSNDRLFGHSITSSSCVPSTSTLPETRSRPSAMWSQYRFWSHALLSEPCVKLDRLKQSSLEPAMRLSGSVRRLLVDLDTHMMLAARAYIARFVRSRRSKSAELKAISVATSRKTSIRLRPRSAYRAPAR
jgi:hypothetical protein